MAWSKLPFFTSSKNYLARYKGERRQHQEWTSLEFGKCRKAVEENENWGKLVAVTCGTPMFKELIMRMNI